ncbi:hypothetical protein [Alteromonas gracilis]|jgi:hypothetical protein|uniref:hypothetical protein n=1 Tax=Alteromonas gracilis TaxID=1479524 RepID=UPI003218F386
MKTGKWYALLGLFTVLFLAACGEKSDEGLGRYGMLDESTPEYTTVMFLRSVYEDDNLDAAIAVSSEKMSRILTRYHSNRNVQRHLLNLRYDSVIITPQSTGGVGRSEFSEKSTITVFLSGTYGEDKVEDLRSLDLIKEDGEWKVNKIHPDTYL